jgi:glucoamylase
MRTLPRLALAGSALALFCGSAAAQPVAPPVGVWAYAGKTAVGSAYEAYVDGAYRDGGPTGAVSKVWYSVAKGVLTETMYGLIHEAQIKQLRIAVRTPAGLAIEGEDTTARTEYLHRDAAGRPLSPAVKITTTDRAGRFVIEKQVFTDPDRQTLFLRVKVRALKGPVTPLLLLEPHMANTALGDLGSASPERLHAHEGQVHLVLRGAQPFARAGAGALPSGSLSANLPSAQKAEGVILLGAELAAVSGERTFDLAIGFGPSEAEADQSARATLAAGHDQVLARFNGTGAHVGWEDYLASLTELPRLARQSTDGGKLAYSSALALKVQEDRTYAGALIASLSNPWGDTVDASKPSTGYKAVWPRDFYHCAMALAALGDRQTPLAAFRYLPRVQVGPQTPASKGAGGWFLQKTHVDGTPEWVAVQLDQTAMPIMLGWKLWKLGWLPEAELRTIWPASLKRAADFLADGGAVDIDWNKGPIAPPRTQQERWEEQEGYSPSTTAAVVAGLVTAADMAEALGDAAAAARYRQRADRYAAEVEARSFTTNGRFGDGRYYLRISANPDPNDRGPLQERNGQPAAPEDTVVDAGFLELVRYGVRRADDPHVLASLPELDDMSRPDMTRVKYLLGPHRSPGWRRYGVDGYGEDVATGLGYGAAGEMSPGQRGRVWPIFTGERGHYELALASLRGRPGAADLARIRDTYVRAMESFANGGLLLPEQVWDGVGKPSPHGYVVGEGTNSATPLAWAHAEYVRLLRSLSDGAVWDHYPTVAARYAR